MNVDQDVPTGSKRPSPTSSPPEKRTKLVLPQAQLTVLNNKMNELSDAQMWQARSKEAGDDDSLWGVLAKDVLMHLTSQLAATYFHGDIIASQTLEGAERLVKSFKKAEFEQWKDGVRTGVERKDWSDLIAHPKLKRPTVPDSPSGVPIELQHAVIDAWNMGYRSDAYKCLLEAIDQLQALPAEAHYVKTVPIVQSSGMGKSKTVDRIATERILFPLCLRESLGKNAFAYPPTDIEACNHLLRTPPTADAVRCKVYLRSFLSSLFASARRRAEQVFPTGTMVSYKCMAREFYDLFADRSQRNDFYKEVVVNASKGHSTKVRESFRELKDSLKQRCYDWPATSCPFLISMDEAHVLWARRVDSGYTLFSRLNSVLSELVSEDFCVIFLSTSTLILELDLPEATPLLRGKCDERVLPAAFTELPFDAHIIAEPLVPRQATLTSVGSLEFTAKFGRPLFYASYLSRKALHEYHGAILVGMMQNVREKLCGRSWPPQSAAVLDTSSIAVLSARLLLDLSPSASDAERYDKELVRNHLRILYSVPQNGTVMVTGSSPEPLLAEASAEIMHYSLWTHRSDEPYMDIWGLLGDFVDRGLAAQDTIGQLIGRTLSISAMDFAIDALADVCELKYQTPVTVAAYYKAFLTDEAWETLRHSTPANRARLSKNSATTTFEDAFANAYLHFSHYGKAIDASPMRDAYAWAHWLRGTAVVCLPDEEVSDRIAPIYFSNAGTVSPLAMSVNLDQDKTGQSADHGCFEIQSAEGLGIFSHGQKLPYIAATHRYALTVDEGMTSTMPSSPDLPNHPKKDQEAPRYQIDFRGLAAYGNITDQVRVIIRRMINGPPNALFEQHARQYAVPLLRQMLPVLAGDPDSTAWFGGLSNAEAWNASHSTAGSSTAGSGRAP